MVSCNPVRILVAHNKYLQFGGEDQVFLEETDLLQSRGHEVIRYLTSNERIADMRRAELARDAIWSSATWHDMRKTLRRERPDVLHFHNTFPLLSPSAYYAAEAEGVPVVQTLHNYRLLCPNGLFFRDGRPCEDCLGKSVPWPSVLHACYRNDRPATGVTAAMLSVHRALGTWSGKVDSYIALTDFARDKLIKGGLPADKVTVKPNFVHPDPGAGDGSGGYALFAGRLSLEKGISTLLEAWERLGERTVPLKVVGDGPLAGRVARAAKQNPRVEWLGYRPAEEVRALMKDAVALVFPSEWYETFGRVAVESFACGTPVVAADIGAIAELVEHGRTGLRFRPGDAEDLASRVAWLLERPEERARMRREARAEFEAHYTAENNYRMLMEIYESVTERAGVPT